MAVATIAIDILGNAKSLEDALNGAREKIASFGDKLGGWGDKLSATVTAPIAGVAAVALNSAADFETAMNSIQAVSGATAADMKRLQDEALHLGAELELVARVVLDDGEAVVAHRADARAVGHNIFLDGNTDKDSLSVDRELWVGDLQGGLVMNLFGSRLAYTYVYRTPEYEQQDDPDKFASIILSIKY